MKKLFTICTMLLITAVLWAQAPEKISYQAIVRNASNALVTSTSIGMQISILQGSATDTTVYVEKQNPTTNANGLVSVEIGTGIVISGNFAEINWANGPFFIKTEIDPVGGSNYSISGTSELLSVPYALYAKSATNGLQDGTAAGQMMYWNGKSWVMVAPGVDNQTLSFCGGVPIWGPCPGTVTSLNCSAALNTGNLIEGISASAVSASIPYLGGNGGPYAAQSVSSTGVTGLTASLVAGKLANGAGNLTYTISGIPASSGTAIFSITLGGKSCSFTVNVAPQSGTISAINCGTATTNGILTEGSVASGVSTTIAYAGGNGGTYPTQSVSSIGVTGLTANRPAGTFNIGAGTITYTITGTATSAGTANFPISVGGKTCVFTLNVVPNAGSINTLDCANAVTTGTLTVGTAASGVSSSIAYTGGNGVAYAAQSVSSTGVTGLTANLAAGTFNIGAGNITYTITGTATSAGTANFAIALGGKACVFAINVVPKAGTISTLDCGGAITTGNPILGAVASGVSISIAYTGGNGGVYAAQSIISTGVTGLTANLTAGTFANGAGTLVFTINGIPAALGAANFALVIGGQSCIFVVYVPASYPVGSVFCDSGPTTIINVTNPTTGRIWMDRNLGASQAATSSTDAAAYGDLYQWGRAADGHQCRNSATTSSQSSADQPGNSNFILASNKPYDWRSPKNDALWQGLSGVNNPCPTDYRLPSLAELQDERLSWIDGTAAGAFTSPLKFPLAGYRADYNGVIYDTSNAGNIWSSAVIDTDSWSLRITISNSGNTNSTRAKGASVRCIKN
ncbi:MAG: hypothetical protein ACOYOA_03195 [Saprospiraceae bacterium]